MTFFDVFQSIENSGLGNTIRESNWAFAVIESVHLLALAVMGGSVLLVDMRMLGLGLTERPVRELAQNTFRYMTLALVVLIVTGIGLFFSEAVKCFYSTPFWVKMSSLFLAILFTYTVRRRVVMGATDPARGTARTVAVLSLVLWFSVAASGRWIGFSG
jgi:uncharacterized membrane protein YhdT